MADTHDEVICLKIEQYVKYFNKEIAVRWADVDQNRHVRHSAYYDYGAHARIKFFTELGYDAQRLDHLRIGPILFKEECSFIREIRADETIRVNLLRGEMTPDVARWVLHHEIFHQDGSKAAHITARGAWMDLEKRKLIVPPQELAAAFHELPAGEDFVYQKKKKID